MWVKICANTCAEDALKAAELGADAVGFVFAPSKRQVTAEQVRAISAAMPKGVERVGVFGDLPADIIAEAVHVAGLTAVQMHGGTNPALAERLSHLLGPEIALIPVVHWEVNGSASSVGQAADRLAQIPGGRVLVDAKFGGASGGTGMSFDWQAAQPIFDAQRQRGLRLILAGGLRPDNVAQAIRTLKPWGVDVASGVEREPGRKDFDKLRRFIANARGAI